VATLFGALPKRTSLNANLTLPLLLHRKPLMMHQKIGWSARAQMAPTLPAGGRDAAFACV
jgi:hypothetical protein